MENTLEEGRLEQDSAGSSALQSRGPQKGFGRAPMVLLCPRGVARAWDLLAKSPFSQHLLSPVTQ